MTSRVVFVDPKEFPPEMAGADISWDLSVGGIYTDPFCAAVEPFKAKGVPLPVAPACGSVLLRVMQALYQDRACLVKPSRNPGGTKDPTYSVLPRKDDDGRMAFVASWAAWVVELYDTVLGEDGTVTSAFLGHDIQFSNEAPESERDRVTDNFHDEIQKLGTTEQSQWLVSVVKGAFKGVPMPGGSGHFFIGPNEVAIWRAMKPVLEKYGLRLYETPAMRSDQLADTVMTGLRQQVLKEAAELQEDLKKHVAATQSGKRTQDRVLRDRQQRCAATIERIERYEALFDTKLTELKEATEQLQNGFLASNIVCM